MKEQKSCKTIMIVDDEPDIATTVKEGIERLDKQYKVIYVENGIKFLELLKNKQIPDLVILDIMMPEMSGWEILNRLREKNEWESKIPLVFLTARTDTFTKTFGKTVSMDFIEKPFDIVDLKKRIDKILKKSNEKYPALE